MLTWLSKVGKGRLLKRSLLKKQLGKKEEVTIVKEFIILNASFINELMHFLMKVISEFL